MPAERVGKKSDHPTADTSMPHPAAAARPTRGDPRYLGVVAAGGAVGATARFLISSVLAPRFSGAGATMIINVVGCLLLGMLLHTLARHGPDLGARRTLRLFLGTGLLGGFTTYSALATDAGLLLESGHWLTGLGYGVGSLLFGLLAAAAGMALAGLGRTVPGRRSE